MLFYCESVVYEMNERQKRFADEYLIDLNAEAAAIRAGYSRKYARGNAHKLVANNCIKAFIDKRMAEKESELIAGQDEVLKYLTAVMRGGTSSHVLARDEVGADRVIEKPPDEKERLKAAELLGKRYGLYTDRVNEVVDMELNVTVDYGDGK